MCDIDTIIIIDTDKDHCTPIYSALPTSSYSNEINCNINYDKDLVINLNKNNINTVNETNTVDLNYEPYLIINLKTYV